MRVLVLHSRYRSGASGENRVVEDEVRLLRESGHEVLAWTPTPADSSLGDRARLGLSAVWSRTAAGRIERLATHFRPDVIHLHNLFPLLSPAALRAASARAPTVISLHNYRMMCLPADFLRNGQACEDCLGHVPWRGVVHRCYRGSTMASAALAGSLAGHRALGSFGRVDRFLAVSDFVRQKHVEAGVDPHRISVKRNFAWPSPQRRGPGGHYLYLGRISYEKGVSTLVDAWAADAPGPLLIAGDGPERAALEARAPAGVEFLGHVQTARVQALLAEARALILPTVCYEAAPRSVIEAMAAGVPAIASRTPAVAELVGEDRGLLVPAGNPAALGAAARLLADDRLSVELGAGAATEWSRSYSPASAVAALEAAYAEAIGSRRSAGRQPRPVSVKRASGPGERRSPQLQPGRQGELEAQAGVGTGQGQPRPPVGGVKAVVRGE
jgi:glycosyltransferase involved in cell wall biosynthesis